MLIEGILATLVATSTVGSETTTTVVETTKSATTTVSAPQQAIVAPAAGLPKKLAVGTQGWFNPGLLLQGWFIAEANEETSSTEQLTTSTFRLRRAEIRALGDIIPDLFSYNVMFDAARFLEPINQTVTLNDGEKVTFKQSPGSSSIISDFFVTLKSSWVDASIGQFKIPVSWEGYNPAAKVLFPERSVVSMFYGDRRDMGIRLTKTFKLNGEDFIMYSAGAFNGSGQGILDTNNSKDLGLRLELYPIKGLMVGGVVYSTVGKRSEAGSKDRYEGDLRFERWNFILQAELIHGVDTGAMAKKTDGQGWYVAAAFKPLDFFQFAARLGRLDPDVDSNVVPTAANSALDEVWVYEGELAYLFEKYEARLQLAIGRFEYDQRADKTQVIFAAQASY